MSTEDVLRLAVGLVTICNPVGNLAIFMSLTEGYSKDEERKTALKTAMAVFTILIIVTWIGDPLLHFLGISLPVLQIAGGFIISNMGFSMMQAKTSHMRYSSAEHEEASHADSIAVVPLAIPILAGPGAMSVIIVATDAHTDAISRLIVSSVVLCFSLVLGLVFYYGTPIGKFLGVQGMKIMSRIMGLVLACLGVTMVIEGIQTVFKLA